MNPPICNPRSFTAQERHRKFGTRHRERLFIWMDHFGDRRLIVGVSIKISYLDTAQRLNRGCASLRKFGGTFRIEGELCLIENECLGILAIGENKRAVTLAHFYPVSHQYRLQRRSGGRDVRHMVAAQDTVKL